MNVVQLWDICLRFEYNKRKILSGLADFFRPYRNKKILDCACGTGFLTLDLAKKGYDITFSDASPGMLRKFRQNAKKLGVSRRPYLLEWKQLPRFFKNKFDIIFCKGPSLVYVNSWDSSKISRYENWAREALDSFYLCLKPGGMLYLDTTSEANLRKKGPQIVEYKERLIDGAQVKLIDKITNYPIRNLRVWEPVIFVNGKRHRLTRYSYYLPHAKLRRIMAESGFHSIKKPRIKGEHYDVFVTKK